MESDESIYFCAHVCDFKTDHVILESQLGGSFLEKTDPTSLSSSELLVALHLGIRACEISPSTPVYQLVLPSFRSL